MPIGKNLRKENTWEPVLRKFKSRLSQWREKKTLFFGVLTMVVMRITRMKRNFLWGGEEQGRRKIAWVKGGGLLTIRTHYSALCLNPSMGETLAIKYRRIFLNSEQQNDCVRDVGCWEDFNWELPVVDKFFEELNGATLVHQQQHKLAWRNGSGAI
ncbi:hypothetical protein GmHk_04G011090 [Glycine max]|nr:hypothetical protein GmHk_04G011090 [Glycine max]